MKEYKLKLRTRKYVIYLIFFINSCFLFFYFIEKYIVWLIGSIIIFCLSLIFFLKDGVYFKVQKKTGDSFIELNGQYNIRDYLRFKRALKSKQ